MFEIQQYSLTMCVRAWYDVRKLGFGKILFIFLKEVYTTNTVETMKYNYNLK